MKKEKIIDLPWNEDLIQEKIWRESLIMEYNNTSPFDKNKRTEILNTLFAHIGDYSIIEVPFYDNWGGKNIYLQNDVYLNYGVSMVGDGCVYIGRFTKIAPGVKIITTSHPINIKDRQRNDYLIINDVHIGKNVWIGCNATILPGVTIGKNSVIGAGSVVTKDIPSNVVAFGNPCKVIKKIDVI